MRFTLNQSVRMLAGLALGIPALARPFTYTYYPADTAISIPVATDFAVIGYSGGQYNEDTFEREFTGPSSPTVTIADGADIPDAEVFNSSTVNLTGGTAALFGYDNTTVNVHAGHVPFSVGFESSVFNVHSGSVDELDGQGRQVNVYGGAIGTLVANSDTTPFGDNLGGCTANILGGTFISGGVISAFNDGVVNLRGGLIQSDFIRAAEGGTFNIFGANLVAQLVDADAAGGYSVYILSGSLEDGQSIDGVRLEVRNDGVTYGHSTFNLITVPNSGAAAVFGLAGVAANRRRRGPFR